MTGEEFFRRVGELRKDRSNYYYLEDPTRFKELIYKHRLRVIGRARPDDKHTLTIGLKEIGKGVALTGEGINDIRGL